MIAKSPASYTKLRSNFGFGFVKLARQRIKDSTSFRLNFPNGELLLAFIYEKSGASMIHRGAIG